MPEHSPAILVTGGAGYIGSHVCKELSKNGYTPICYDNLVYGHESVVKWGPFEKGDILDRATLRSVCEKYKPQGAIHLAAFAYVGESVKDPSKYYNNNVAGSIALLDTLKECGINRLVFSSTCAVYGIPKNVPITEHEQPAPVNPYGATKLMIERIMNDYHTAYGLNYIALRYFNAAGADPEGETGELHNPETHLIPLLLDVPFGRREKLTVLGNDYPTPDGTCVRDYIHVTDLARAHVLALHRLEKNLPVALSTNLGTGIGYSIMDMIRVAEKVTGKTIAYTIAPRRAGDPPMLVADAGQSLRELGWKAEFADINDIIRHAWNFHVKAATFA